MADWCCHELIDFLSREHSFSLVEFALLWQSYWSRFDKYVVDLDVSVDNIVMIEKLHTLNHLVDHIPGFLFSQMRFNLRRVVS